PARRGWLRRLGPAPRHRAHRAGRCLRAGLPAASGGRPRWPDGAAAQDSAPEAGVAGHRHGRRHQLTRGMPERLLTRCRDIPGLRSLDTYRQHGGYEAVRKALTQHQPEELVEMVKASNLRGRGGAGFPTRMKWGLLPKQTEKPGYLAVDADQSEAGAVTDPRLNRADPQPLLEGVIISSFAIKCHLAYIYIRGEMLLGYQRLWDAVREAREAGLLGKNILGTGYDLEVVVHRGAGAYICGEETGLLESLEGKRG